MRNSFLTEIKTASQRAEAEQSGTELALLLLAPRGLPQGCPLLPAHCPTVSFSFYFPSFGHVCTSQISNNLDYAGNRRAREVEKRARTHASALASLPQRDLLRALLLADGPQPHRT